MKSIIGRTQPLTDKYGTLSLIRKDGVRHAFLVLETCENGERYIQETNLYINRDDNKKAIIIVEEGDKIDLKNYSDNAFAVTWTIDRKKIQQYRALLQSEIERGEQGKINYIKLGESALTGKGYQSLQFLGSEKLTDWSLEKCDNSVSELLLRKEGHNCFSWAKSMVLSLELPTPKSWSKCIIQDPYILSKKVNGDEVNPDETGTTCNIL